MNKDRTRSLIARVVNQHKKRVTSRGTRCPSKGPGQRLRIVASKRNESFPWRARGEDLLDISIGQILYVFILLYKDGLYPSFSFQHNYIVSLHRVGIDYIDNNSMIENCVCVVCERITISVSVFTHCSNEKRRTKLLELRRLLRCGVGIRDRS